MDAPSDIFIELHVGDEGSEPVVLGFVAPLARELAGAPELDSLFYGVFSDPRPQVRFRVAGPEEWCLGPVRARLEARAGELRALGLVHEAALGHYAREVERYGGEEGMRLTERIYHHDSLACLELLEAEAAGDAMRSRREIAVAMTERYLDALGIRGTERIAFYEFAARWPSPEGDWAEDDAARFDARYEAVKDGLALLASGSGADPETVWGSSRAARIAEGCLSRLEDPLNAAARGIRDGSVRRDLAYLAWSWTHMHCNRLGISALSEAILRQVMLRHHRAGERESG